MTRWPSTLRWRLTLWYTALLGAPLIALAAGSYFLFARTLHTRSDRFIGDALDAFARELVAERRASLGAAAAMRSTAEEVRFPGLQIRIFDGTGRLLAASPAAAHLPGGHDRVVSRPITLDARSFTLAGTYSLADVDDVLARLREILLIAIPLLLVCASTGGYFLAARSLAPVSSMAARAAEIGASNLEERLPVAGGDELVGLARVFNDLLDRLEGSFAQQRRFMQDASHELRTPTAILRTEADVTLSQPHRTEEEYRESVAIMRDAVRRLTRIVDDLFLLARADAGDLGARREPVYLEEIVHDAARGVRPLADRRNVRVTVSEVIEAPFRGDADLLGRLVLNLLDNAIKHSPPGASVDIRLTRSHDRYEIRVVDAGSGIPPEVTERVFERFFRVDAARSRADRSLSSGAGLGLPIARRIAELHGGRLELVSSRPGRTEFRLELPADAAPVETATV